MSIKSGDTIPNITLAVMTADGPGEISSDEIFRGKKVVLFALPGAYTPTCSQAHLPGYVVNFDALKAKGVDTVACLSVNDAFVMGAWGAANNADNILMLADGSGAFTAALGLELDLTARHMGVRSQRYALIADDGVVQHINIEQGAQFEVSNAETILNLL